MKASNEKEIDRLAKKVWEYHLIHHQLKKADCIIALGSRDTRVAERAAELFMEGWAPLVVCSGAFGRLTKYWKKPEAEVFAETVRSKGVPADKILLESKSTNTGENILFSKELLKSRGYNPQIVIAAHKPYMERRTFVTFRKVWPEIEVVVASPQISYEAYPTADISKKAIINGIVGDVVRIKVYGERGFQIPQEIPPNVWSACQKLISLGYNDRLVD
ncbi:MAG: hypothetical protein G01um101472_349 [Parcubacteria group bacterium Gr01-1014_72]|nr:MAG: hypothetical protein G01um101472_349 [Parcubacteria group bacterium Gr01-1014_72]